MIPRGRRSSVGPPRYFFTKSESKTGYGSKFQDNFERPFRLLLGTSYYWENIFSPQTNSALFVRAASPGLPRPGIEKKMWAR